MGLSGFQNPLLVSESSAFSRSSQHNLFSLSRRIDKTSTTETHKLIIRSDKQTAKITMKPLSIFLLSIAVVGLRVRVTSENYLKNVLNCCMPYSLRIWLLYTSNLHTQNNCESFDTAPSLTEPRPTHNLDDRISTDPHHISHHCGKSVLFILVRTM